MYCESKAPSSHVKVKRYINYCGVAAATLLGKTLRMTLGGSAYQLSDNAAEEHLRKRLTGDEDHFAIKAIENSIFDKKFKNVADDLNKDRNFLRSQSTEVKLELFALFQ